MSELTRPLIGIENRTAQEVFDIMCDRISHRIASTGSTDVREAAGDKLLRRLVERYRASPAVIATAFDSEIDRSGNSLGWLRELSRAALTNTLDKSVPGEANPYVLGPVWKEPEDDCWTAEIQVIGGHEIKATIHAGTEQEVIKEANTIIAALSTKPNDMQTALREERERCALLVESGYTCLKCGAVFLAGDGHPDPECERPDWDRLEMEGIATAIRALDDNGGE